MLIRFISLIALALAMGVAGFAQMAPRHGPPDCDYAGSSCVWGQLFDTSGPQLPGETPMDEGPIDLCYYWDYSCAVPVQSVCELHGPHGWSAAEGSYFFVLSTNQSWRIKPRVAGSHLSWYPSSMVVSQGVPSGSVEVFNFFLQGAAASTSICDY